MATATRKPATRQGAKPKSGALHLQRAVTIHRPVSELYGFWRRFENLARIVRHPVKIMTTSDTESHWAVSAPAGKEVEWDAEVTEDRPNEFIAWQSKPDADVPNRGSVRFQPAPGGEATEVVVDLEYEPPGGKIGAMIAKLADKAASQQVGDALQRFKALMETGEIPTTGGQTAGV